MPRGLALYKKDDKMYAFHVKYEYAETRFVGFDETQNAYIIRKLSDEQKEWLKTHNPKDFPKTKNLFFVGDYYASIVMLNEYPKGKPYTQLQGGGGVFKITRNISNVVELLKNPTVIKALEKHGKFNEGYEMVKEIIRESVAGLFEDYKKVNMTVALIEDEKSITKLDKIYNSLKNKGKIPENFIKPLFKDGRSDYHMTITFGELPLRFKRDVNKEVMLNITSIGISDEAIALGVSGDYFSKNEQQHITLAFKKLPQSSNDIESWVPLKTPFKIKGIIREFDVDKNIILREANQIYTGNFQAQAPAPAATGSSFPKTNFPSGIYQPL